MAVLFTFGANDSGTARILPDNKGHARIHTDGNCNVLGRVDHGPLKVDTVLIYGEGTPQPVMDPVASPSLIFNQISDADTHAGSLKRCSQLVDELNVPVINDPSRVLENTRDGVYRALTGMEGVIMPKTIAFTPHSPTEVLTEIEDKGLSWPVIQRIAGDHNASSTVLIEGPDDIRKLNRFPYDGRRYYLTEYVEYADSSGIYRKHRICMIDGRPFLRHCLFNQHWIINSKSVEFAKAHPEFGSMAAMAVRYRNVLADLAAPALERIAEALQLDYFGIDCHINDQGQVLVFEANPNMEMTNFGSKEFVPAVHAIREGIRQLIASRSGEPTGSPPAALSAS